MGDRESECLCPGPLGFCGAWSNRVPTLGLETKPWTRGPTLVTKHVFPSLASVNEISAVARKVTGHGGTGLEQTDHTLSDRHRGMSLLGPARHPTRSRDVGLGHLR